MFGYWIAGRANADVAIISDNLADGPLSGLRILPEVRKANPETRLLLAMSSSDRELVIEAFRFGADGVFCRNSPFNMLCKSVDALANGQIWANSKELRYVMEEFMRAPKQRKVDPTVENRMTKREGDVVRLAVEGLSNREIAAQLDVSIKTISIIESGCVKQYDLATIEKKLMLLDVLSACNSTISVMLVDLLR